MFVHSCSTLLSMSRFDNLEHTQEQQFLMFGDSLRQTNMRAEALADFVRGYIQFSRIEVIQTKVRIRMRAEGFEPSQALSYHGLNVTRLTTPAHPPMKGEKCILLKLFIQITSA